VDGATEGKKQQQQQFPAVKARLPQGSEPAGHTQLTTNQRAGGKNGGSSVTPTPQAQAQAIICLCHAIKSTGCSSHSINLFQGTVATTLLHMKIEPSEALETWGSVHNSRIRLD